MLLKKIDEYCTGFFTVYKLNLLILIRTKIPNIPFPLFNDSKMHGASNNVFRPK